MVAIVFACPLLGISLCAELPGKGMPRAAADCREFPAFAVHAYRQSREGGVQKAVS